MPQPGAAGHRLGSRNHQTGHVTRLGFHERKNTNSFHDLKGRTLRLDEIDHHILASLTQNGRESFATLGQRVGLSTAATKRRVDRLRHDGVIRRFTAEVEPTALGWTIDAFVELYCDGRVPPDRMRELVATIPEVVEAYTVTGESDGILRVRAADTSEFEKVLGLIRNHPGVTRTRSSMVLSRL